MNEDELIARKYLSALGHKQIVYEPDGNQPPDFLIDRTIACEVRRLNQFHKNGVRNEPLENLEYPLYHKLKQIFKSFKNDSLPNSAFVGYTVRRPFKLNKAIIKEIEAICNEQINYITTTKKYTVGQNLTLTFIPTDKPKDQVYLFGSMLDYDKGGLIIEETIKSLNIIISEKDDKVLPHFQNYNEWWLILVNHIFFDIDRVENEQVKRRMIKSEIFSQIHVVSRIEHGRGYIIQ